jgi:hypothetical protein
MKARHLHGDDENIEGWRGEPETVDVHAQQGEVDWTRQPRSDQLLLAGLLLKLRGLIER